VLVCVTVRRDSLPTLTMRSRATWVARSVCGVTPCYAATWLNSQTRYLGVTCERDVARPSSPLPGCAAARRGRDVGACDAQAHEGGRPRWRRARV